MLHKGVCISNGVKLAYNITLFESHSMWDAFEKGSTGGVRSLNGIPKFINIIPSFFSSGAKLKLSFTFNTGFALEMVV